MAAVEMGFGGQSGRVHAGGDGEAVGQRGGAAGVVPLIHAVGRGRLAPPPHHGLLQGGDGHGERHWRVTGGGVHAARLRHATAAQGRDAAAAAARAGGGVQHQATGRQAVHWGRGQGRQGGHGGLHTKNKG